MKLEYIDLAPHKTRDLPGLKGTDVPATFVDAVKVDLSECTLLYVSGKLATVDSVRLVGSTMKEQARQALTNVKNIVEHAGGTMDNVVRIRLFITQWDDETFRQIHEARAEFFRPGHYPSSTLIQVTRLAREALIEIDVDAVIPRK